MPIPEERLHNRDRLNRWFAVSSILMTVSLFWMIEVDYARPWRDFQDRYAVTKAAVAHLDYLNAIRDEKVSELKEAEQRLADARDYLEKTGAVERERLSTELAHAELEFRKADAPFSKAFQVLEVTKDTYEKRLGEFGPEHAITRAAHEQFQSEEDEVERLKKDKEHWEDEKRSLTNRLRDLEKGVRAAEKRVAELKQTAEAALQKDQQFRGVLTDEGLLGGLPVVKTVMNMPLLDFAAPKNTPARHQVNQLVLPDVRQRLNYLESYTTDRCTTCHVAIADPEFSKEELARKLERSLPGISEALQRSGQAGISPPAPPMVAGTNVALPAGRVTDHWTELSREQQNAYFDELLSLVNGYLKSTGRKTLDLRQPVLAHPDLELYVTVDSPHPMAKIGCTVCHEGNPQETDFVQAAHSPPTHAVQKKWEEEYYLHELGVPNVTFETIAHYWDRPMRLPQHTEAGCAKCHTQVADISRFESERVGTRINLGQHLFREIGCINCHNVDSLKGSRRVGPDLTSVAAKLKPGFVQQWAYFPQKFRPTTRMPHFFGQENSLPESRNQFDPDPVLRTQTEVAAISKYLFTVSASWAPLKKPDDVQGDAERGRELFRSVGCLGCHSNLAEFGEEWITRDLIHGEKLDKETATHRYKGMTTEQRERYAMEHFATQADTFFRPEKAKFDPDAPYTAATFSRFAPELSGVGSKVSFEWLYSWLIEPTHYSPDTKMPSLRLTPGEAADIAAFLTTLKRDEFVQREFEMNKAAWDMADGIMFTLLSAQRSEKSSQAMMRDEGDELTQTLVRLLTDSLGERATKDASATRFVTPAEKRQAGEQAAYDLVRGLSPEDKKLVYVGNKMIGHYGCYACHIIPGFEKTTEPGTDLSAWAEKPITQLDFAFYDHAFHHMREEKADVFGFVYPRDAKELNHWSPIDDAAKEEITHTHGAFAKHKMLNPRIWDREKIKRPYDKLKMPNFYFSEEEAEALTTYLLSRIPPRVTDSLKVNYQGDELGPIAKGRNLTRELNCVGCHQIEDNAPMVQQYFRRQQGDRQVFDQTNAPPLLWGEGAKVQHQWFHHFLQQVEPLRPWLSIRMPSFHLTGDEATTLVEYFAALSRHDSDKLAGALAPVEAFVKESTAAGANSTGKTQSEKSPPKWYEQDTLRESTAFLRNWAVERSVMRKADLDPLTASPDRLPAAYDKLLKRTRFLRDLYDVDYPFIEPPTPLSSPERHALGTRFFNDMGCLKCHVLGRMLPGPAKNTDEFVQVYRLDGVRGDGEQAVALINEKPYPIGSIIDGHKLVSASNTYNASGDVDTKAIFEGPGAAGATERVLLVAASAPNLSLTQQRLRRGWVYGWMLEPQLIQPGTKMPQNFVDGVSPYAGDERYPGTGVEHINLLVDFLYDAGAKSDRMPLPKLMAAEESEFGEEEEFEE